MFDFIWLIPLLPFVGFLLNVFVVRNERTAGAVATGAVTLSFLVGLATFIQFAVSPPATTPPRVDLVLWQWMTVGTFNIPFGLLFDPLSGVMVLLVTGVGALIHLYSMGYMHGDKRVVRYFAYLNLFVAMMLVLVMANNMLLLFLGWEGVGLCSFLLIGHWFERKSASGAAVKAFVVNRIGDAAMLLAMMAIFTAFGTLTFYESTTGGALLPGFLERTGDVAGRTFDIFGQPLLITTGIAFLLLIAVTGKSAQVPLFVWLPDAMAGPTPVSALIHAATMVTAGVYLMARTHPIFQQAPAVQNWVVFVGTLTALLAATAALAQWDIKRVLAYSTVSQLGFMVAACGMGIYVAAMFHLLTHGVFKALLFLGSGSVIHGTHNTQDMRKMGGLRAKMPTTYWTYLVGAVGLTGVLPIAGFWSKDEIIAHAWTSGNLAVFFGLFITLLFTAFYMARQIALVFDGQQRDKGYQAHESGQVMRGPLVALAVGTMLVGFINLPGEWGLGHLLGSWLKPVLNEAAPEFGAAQITLMLLTTLASAGVAYAGWRYYVRQSAKIKLGGNDPIYRATGELWNGLAEAWYFDRFYEKLTVVPGFKALARFLAQVFDPQGVDGLVRGVGRLLGLASGGLRSLQTGLLRSYALFFLVGVVLMVGYFVMVR